MSFTSSKTERFVLFPVQGNRKILRHVHSSKASIFFPFLFPHCPPLASVCHCREYYGFCYFNFGSFPNIPILHNGLYSVPLYGYFILNSKYTGDLEGAGYDGSSWNSPERNTGSFSEMSEKLQCCERVSYNYELYVALHQLARSQCRVRGD